MEKGTPPMGPVLSFRSLISSGLLLALTLGACGLAQESPRRLPALDASSGSFHSVSVPAFAGDSPSAKRSLGPDAPAIGPPEKGASDTDTVAVLRASARAGGPVPYAAYDEPWCWQILPSGLIYRSYLAGVRESRFASAWVRERNLGDIWDIALGGRVGLLRYGTKASHLPQGWQLDIEGAGFPRLDFEHNRDLVAADFRFGVPLTYGRGRYQAKFAFYHLSSHLGDEFMLRNPTVSRVNYSRDVLVWGNSFYFTDDLRLYAEAAWAYYSDDSDPWEFQFGIDYSPARPNGFVGAPFFAINTHLRQEIDFGGNMVVQTGWQWRGGNAGHLVRMGMQYFTGMSEQYEFFDVYEEKLGLALWYDY